MREPLLVLDHQLRVESANRAFYRTFRVAPAETVGKFIYDLGNHQWDIPRLRELLEEILPQSTTIEDFQVEHDFEQLGRRTMLLNARRIQDPQHKTRTDPAGHRGHHRTQAGGRNRRARLAAIVESSDDAIVGKDLRGIITSWNRGAEILFGYSASEMVGQSIRRLIPPERMGEEDVILAHIKRGECMQHFETVRLRKDGSFVNVSVTVSAIKDAEGRIVGASKVARNITDRKLAEEALRASRERMLLATETTGVGIWEWNVRTNQIQWDAQMFRIYGIAPTPDGWVPYSTWSETVLPEDLSRQEAVLQNTVHRIGQSTRTFRIHRVDDGESRHIHSVEITRANAQGQVEWVVGTNLDITDLQQAQEALRASEERLRAFSSQLEQLVTDRTRELVQSHERLRALGKELNLTEQRERKRLASEMHDSLAHGSRSVASILDGCNRSIYRRKPVRL